ncbi:hypothetical protein OPV22_017592 [Ensete ventricosum]|uniref:Beta-glucosidase n=1 Tax=Ensete ventricosum TaxID=4639 RepID=A0AAV8QYB7_ENSVE|nr:hypothetical protein OPV22_017592 [Ensete ventricosum]
MPLTVSSIFFPLFVLLSNDGRTAADGVEQKAVISFNRSNFQSTFVFGAASSAYQYEGATAEGGKEPSVWVTFTHMHPEVIEDRSNGDASQRGEIGITLISHWFVPYENSKSDADAVARALDFMFRWFMDPLSQGDYPFMIRAPVGDRLPEFTAKQSEMVKGSFDFIGLNYYTTYYANSSSPTTAASSWIYIYPRGIRELSLYVKGRYNDPIIYITENGVAEVNNASWPLNKALQDDTRIDYHRRHLSFVLEAMSKRAKVRGYFAWSLLDNFEWISGYTVRFGLVHVDYFKDGFKRYPKASADWFRQLLKN